MRTYTLLFALGFALAALPAAAEKTPATLELSTQLTELLRVRAMVDAMLKQCSDPEGSSFDARTAFASSPGSFGGVSPQSTYWPEVEAIYADYRIGTCAFLTVDNFMTYYAGVLAENNTEEDLRIVLRFYSSSVGKRFQDSQVVASVAFQEYANDSMKKATTQASEKYMVAMRAIIRKYKKDPH